MILHVANIDKFIEPFIAFVEDNFEDFERHEFFLLGDNRRYPVLQRGNTRFAEDYKSRVEVYSEVLKQMYRAEKIILHGLWNNWIVKMLAFNPWLLNKCYWVIWGGDLYSYKLAERTRKWQIHEVFRRIVIKRMGHLVTHINGDYKLAQQWYDAKGEWRECFMYPSNLYQEASTQSLPHEGVNILLGNSADPSNNHIEALDKLKRHAVENIRVYCPLSYGDQKYAHKVSDYGASNFGEDFISLREFMPLDRYTELLAKIDIAIFNHKRQQGMGNITTLLGMGKKLYLRKEISTWGFLQGLGVTVFDINSLDFSRIETAISDRNSDVVKNYFSENNLISQLGRIFQ